MDCSFHTEEEMREYNLKAATEEAYYAVLPKHMSRAERRTAKGRMLVAQAEAAALRAEVEFLKSELGRYKGNA